jgi:hypothetical protein
MQRYLDNVSKKYSRFRYVSDKNVLEWLNSIKNIEYTLFDDELWFFLFYIDKSVWKDIWFFWFFEVYNDEDWIVFLEKIKSIAIDKGCKSLIWPVNLSIWNSYRYTDSSNDIIVEWEYDTNPLYHKSLLSNWFKVYEEYFSVYRDGINPFNAVCDMKDLTISMHTVNDEVFRIVYDLSIKIFEKAPKISYEEFVLYMKAYIELYKDNLKVTLLAYKWNYIWFVSSIEWDDHFVIKTLWVLKEYRLKWFWNLLLDYTFKNYFNIWKCKSYCVYMRDSWDAMKMSSWWASIYKKHFTYYLGLC